MKELVIFCPVSKRHDINPSFLSGTDVCTSQELNPDTESSTSDTEMKATETGKVNGRKSFSASACRRREKRKLDASESGTKLVELVLQLEKQRGRRERKDEMRELKKKTTSLDNFWKF